MGLASSHHISIIHFGTLVRVLTGFGKLWKFIEIGEVIFHDLESVGKGKFFFKLAMEEFWIFVWTNSKIS